MSRSQKNIWILGGTGFIGSALVRHLAGNKNNSLHILIHKNTPFELLEPYNTFTGSLSSFNMTWLERYPPDVIFHLARMGGQNTLTRFLASHRGAKANQRLINFLTALRTPPVIVYVSGSLMYGNQNDSNMADEDSGLSPISYAKYYKTGENPWIEARSSDLLDIRFARPGWIIGPGSWFKTFYWNIYIKTGKIPLFGDGQQLMSLVHLDDCAGQVANLAENGIYSQNLNIFSNPPVTQKIFAESLAEILNTGISHVSVKTLQTQYNKTVADALLSSIPLQTKYTSMSGFYPLKYPDLNSMLQHTLLTLKNQ